MSLDGSVVDERAKHRYYAGKSIGKMFMSYRTKLTFLITGLLLLTTVLLSGMLALEMRLTLVQEAKLSGEMVAKILARSAVHARQIPREVEGVVEDMMLGQARIAAHLVEAAEAAGWPTIKINEKLKEIVGSSSISEFWITDSVGHSYLHSLDGFEFTFEPDPEKQPQAYIFWRLLEGVRSKIIQNAQKREIDDKIFKYVGVPGVDKARIVQVGVDVSFLEGIANRIGLARMVKSLLSEGDINAIWVIGNDQQTIAHASIFGVEHNARPNANEQALIELVAATGKSDGVIDDEHMAVVAPIDDEGVRIGVALIRLPMDRLWQLMRNLMLIAGGIVLGTLVVGISVSVLMARRITEPVLALTEAAMAMEAGSFAFSRLDRAVSQGGELGRLANTFQRMASEIHAREDRLEAEVKVRTAQLVKAHQRIDEELVAAQALQIAMLPTDFLRRPGFEAFGLMSPAREVGGDFYDYLEIDERHFFVAIGDVSGKGVSPAFFMVLARTTLQNMVTSEASPAKLMTELNNRLCANNSQSLFLTLFCGILNIESGKLLYTNCGHPSPFLLTEGRVEPIPRTGDMALGVMEEIEFSEKEITLCRGEAIFLYTDGFSEAFSPTGELFGEDRLAKAITNGERFSSQALAVQAVGMVEHFAAGTEASDDITCLSLRYFG
jgi:sigma-B regulation protein RsbU (phosphoserine phosphatase)